MARKPWADKGSRHDRGYGHSWTKLRLVALKRDNHQCQTCKREGRLTVAREVDHIIAKSLGGNDTLDNLEATCTPCHAAKTNIEQGYKPKRTIGADGWPEDGELKRFGFSIPDGTTPSGIPVTLVCGPPASGKSTYIRQRASPGDIVIDFDVYLKQIGAQKWTTDKKAVRKAFLIRDAHIRSLAAKTQGQAWIIAMAPTRAERAAWRRALGDVSVVMLDVPAATCISRLTQDEDRAHAIDRMKASIREWWSRYQAGD